MKSSEFLVALVVMVIGLALVALGVFKGPAELIQQGLTLLGVGAGGYTVARGLAKFGQGATQPPAAESAPAAGPTPRELAKIENDAAAEKNP